MMNNCQEYDSSMESLLNVAFHFCPNVTHITFLLINIYSMKQPDLYYFETIKMTSQACSNFEWRIRAAGEYSL